MPFRNRGLYQVYQGIKKVLFPSRWSNPFFLSVLLLYFCF